MRFVHCVDSMTHPEWREGLPAPGLFARTGSAFGDQCLRLGEGLCYGFPVDTAFGIGRHHLGYEMMCVVDYLIRDHAQPTLPMPDGVVVRRLDELPADVDQLYETVLLDKRCLVRRDHRYLRWRYRDNPDRGAYELWAALRDGHVRGLIVLRPDRGLVPDAMTIVELLAAECDRDALDALVAAATARQRAVGRQRLLAVFPQWSHEWRALQQLGFEVAPSANWLQRRLVHSIHSHRLTPGFLATSWWFTLGDSDLA
jgi:hypothetical protein